MKEVVLIAGGLELVFEGPKFVTFGKLAVCRSIVSRYYYVMSKIVASVHHLG